MKWVYDFSEGSREMRDLLGGKGANLAEMVRLLGPDLVPGGFTITTEACVTYMQGAGTVPAGLDEQVDAAISSLERRVGKRFGDGDEPLLLSVRSGGRVSMPGMLETVLNLGLNDLSVEGLAARTGNERFAWDSYRRLVQMFGDVVRSISSSRFEEALQAAKTTKGTDEDTDLDAGDLRSLVQTFRSTLEEETGDPFPQDPREQLRHAITAVFDSWNGDRAMTYRRINGIPDEWGTAVNVQQMVFGTKGDRSGSGVAFTRDERTGEPTCSPVGCRSHTNGCARFCPPSSAISATCKTSSSRSRTGGCISSRPGTPSAPDRRRCGSPAMRWRRAYWRHARH